MSPSYKLPYGNLQYRIMFLSSPPNYFCIWPLFIMQVPSIYPIEDSFICSTWNSIRISSLAVLRFYQGKNLLCVISEVALRIMNLSQVYVIVQKEWSVVCSIKYHIYAVQQMKTPTLLMMQETTDVIVTHCGSTCKTHLNVASGCVLSIKSSCVLCVHQYM